MTRSARTAGTIQIVIMIIIGYGLWHEEGSVMAWGYVIGILVRSMSATEV